jgi:hypothetical protein
MRLYRVVRVLCSSLETLCLLFLATPLSAQDLDPRAYAHAPVNFTIAVAGFSVSHGGVLTDPTLPITDINATVETPSLGLVRTFGLFRRTAQVFAAFPYSWAQVSGKLVGEAASTSRAGLSDMRLRLSVLVHGAPATSPLAIAKAPRRTILGASVTIAAPTGQFFPDKLINVGSNRWGFKPEFAVSQPLGQRWLLDLYAGVWLFSTNDSFYPGTTVRRQAPIGAVQAHLSYNIQRLMWVAFDATYYAGGRSTVRGVDTNDGLSNSRVGATLVLPVRLRHSIKLAASTGAVIEKGTDFTTFSIGWQTAWGPNPKPGR